MWALSPHIRTALSTLQCLICKNSSNHVRLITSNISIADGRCLKVCQVGFIGLSLHASCHLLIKHPPVQSTSPVQSSPVIVDYPTLHALFGKELDCASVVTATHTHAISYKMAFNLHPIICTWDVVTSHC